MPSEALQLFLWDEVIFNLEIDDNSEFLIWKKKRIPIFNHEKGNKNKGYGAVKTVTIYARVMIHVSDTRWAFVLSGFCYRGLFMNHDNPENTLPT